MGIIYKFCGGISMKRTVAWLLIAVLVLGMIPATVISAFAHGYGVAKDGTENQSERNADGQYIPEIIEIDGELSDTGWRQSLWHDVNSSTGVWSNDQPEEKNQSLEYRYQMRTDYNYFYLSAAIKLPEDRNTAVFCVYLSDENPTTTENPVRGTTGGFKFIVNVAADGTVTITPEAEQGGDEYYYNNGSESLPEGAEKDPVTGYYYIARGEKKTYYADHAVNESNNGRSILSVKDQPGYANNTEASPSYTVPAREAYQLEHTNLAADRTVTFEFRNRALDTYDTDKKLYYYVSTGVPRDNPISDAYGYDHLYHPEFSRTRDVMTTTLPTYESWPDTGMQVNYVNDLSGTEGNEEVIPGAITVDGKFDEAIWAGMTGFYEGQDKVPESFKDSVAASTDAFLLLSVDNAGFNEKSDYREKNLNKFMWDELQFKYDVRTDSEYLYAAVYVYALDSDRTSFEMRIFNEDNAQTHSISLGCSKNGTAPSVSYVSRMYTTPNGDGTYTYELKNLNGGLESAAKGVGPYYVYEFKIPLDTVDQDADNLKWSQTEGKADYKKPLVDNTSKDGMFYSITVGLWSDDYSYDDARAWSSCGIGLKNNSFTLDSSVDVRKELPMANYVGHASEGITVDGELDEPHWTSIRGGDNRFDYAKRSETPDRVMPTDPAVTDPPATVSEYERLIYDIKADNDYIYGAAYIRMASGKEWDTNVYDNDSRSLLRFVVSPYGKSDSTATPRRIVNFYHNGTIAKTDSYVYLNDGFVGETSPDVAGVDGEFVGGDVEFRFLTDANGQQVVLVEFKLSLDDLQIAPKLSPENAGDVLFSYYISVEDSGIGAGSASKTSSLIHPAMGELDENFYYAYSTSNSAAYNEYMTLYDNYSAKVTYGDMIDSVVIDGNLDENVWENMTHVDGTNGAYNLYPYQGTLLEYDYSVYVGNRYLYGAAVIDMEITEENDASFDIWLDNGIDERKTIVAAGDGVNTCEFEFYKHSFEYAAEDVIETTQIHYFPNHMYSFDLLDDQYSGPYEEDYWDDNPEAAPDFYLVNGTITPKKNGEHYKYSVQKINGKTYLEFMIDLDSVHCDPDDLRYYVCFDYSVLSTNEDDQLELYYPAPVAETVPFWVTHMNASSIQGFDSAGFIYTDYDTYSTAAADMQHWVQVALKANGDGSYTVTDKLLTQVGVGSLEILDSGADLYYAVNLGTYYEDDNEDTRNIRAQITHDHIKKWGVGDILRFDDSLLDDLNNAALNNATAPSRPIIVYSHLSENGTAIQDSPMLVKTYNGEIAATSLNRKSVNDHRYTGYYVPYTVTRVACNDSIKDHLEVRNYCMPNFLKYGNSLTWMYFTSEKVVPLEHIAPDAVKVDGSLGDTGWSENGWISVDGSANATDYRNESGVDYKYQLRADHDYLYVAAVIESAYSEEVSFKLWLKNDNAKTKYENYYSLANGGSSVLDVDPVTPTHTEVAAELLQSAAKDLVYSEGKLSYPNLLSAVANTDDGLKSYGYNESAMFGNTKELEENLSDGVWVWEAYPQTYGFRYGNEYAVLASAEGVSINSAAGSKDQTVVEFKVGLDEFDASRDGFEYFVQVTTANGTTVYPSIYSEPESETNYYDYSYPDHVWDSTRAIKVSGEDIKAGGRLWLVDSYTPVVTLGAKISANYTAEDGTVSPAIRLGALYTEDYIRKLPTSTTDSVTDYWDVADVGIIALPTAFIDNGQVLDHSNPNTFYKSANNIVKWISNSEAGDGTNFADYENFVFYVTLYGVPQQVDISFCAYIDYYNANGTDTFYDIPMVRSYELVEQTLNENSKLPD